MLRAWASGHPHSTHVVVNVPYEPHSIHCSPLCQCSPCHFFGPSTWLDSQSHTLLGPSSPCAGQILYFATMLTIFFCYRSLMPEWRHYGPPRDVGGFPILLMTPLISDTIKWGVVLCALQHSFPHGPDKADPEDDGSTPDIRNSHVPRSDCGYPGCRIQGKHAAWGWFWPWIGQVMIKSYWLNKLDYKSFGKNVLFAPAYFSADGELWPLHHLHCDSVCRPLLVLHHVDPRGASGHQGVYLPGMIRWWTEEGVEGAAGPQHWWHHWSLVIGHWSLAASGLASLGWDTTIGGRAISAVWHGQMQFKLHLAEPATSSL